MNQKGPPLLKNAALYLQLIEAEREVQDLGELLGQGLLPLQVLHGSVRRAGQRLQQAAQGVLCKHISQLFSLESKRLSADVAQASVPPPSPTRLFRLL